MRTTFFKTSEISNEIRFEVADMIVHGIEDAILRTVKGTDIPLTKWRTTMSAWRTVASRSMLPNLWLSLCTMILRDQTPGLINNATQEQRDYIDSLANACFCLQSARPDQTVSVLSNLPTHVSDSQPDRDKICDCVWEIAHSVRFALFLAARCELGDRRGTGPVCAFPVVFSMVGPTTFSPIGPVKLLAKLASAALEHAIDKCAELSGWIAAVGSAVVQTEELRAGELDDANKKLGRTTIAKAFYAHIRSTLSPRRW